MIRYVYPTSAMLGDYARAAAGFVPTTAILATTPLGLTAAIVLGGFASLFAIFGIRTAVRHGTRIEMTETNLNASGLLPTSIAWGELDRVKLTYYSTQRDRRGGWMQLHLRSGPSQLRVDSRIEGFAELVKAAAKAAELRGLELDPATSANLEALGVKFRVAEFRLVEMAGGVP
jgi:hypothetical protein